MANDSHEKDTQSSSFRDKILRDLEEIKRQSDSKRPTGSLTTDENIAEGHSEQATTQPRVSIKLPLVADEESGSLVTRFSGDTEQEEPEKVVPAEIQDSPEQASEMAQHSSTPFDEVPVATAVVVLDEASAEPDDLTETLAIHKHSIRDRLQKAEAPRAELEDTIITPTPKQQTTNREAATRRRHRQRRKQDSIAKRIVKVVVSLVLLLLVVTAVTGYLYLKSSLEPVNAQATENIQVEIPEGSSTKEIARILEGSNLIKNATVFNYYAKLKSYNNFQSGFYNLNQSMSVDELAKILQEGGTATAQDPISGKILVVEGSTINQIAQAVTKNVYKNSKDEKTPFTADDFLATVKNEEFINKMVAAYPRLLSTLPAADSGATYRLEGYLFPATYDYKPDTTMEGLVELMIAAMDERLQPYYDQLAAKGLDVNQLLTLASLVEKEGATDADRRTIAGVFYNRLNTGMPLQSNIAILYAMGKLGEKTTLKEDAAIDTTINSPYNIYTNTGLMPGPVDSPSQAAIEATFAPNKTNYYYFVADVTTGTVYFAETGEEHEQNVEKYVNSKLNN
ncbi:endolytic transglycosylase MltG [Streptococcus marmotae]|uniref:endolytic transglycosylase MltG n=1 Tax=Streptococcus marmotae TaxID=1825069 RepID=UPI000835EC03|nr:endolytic transglycosylase MltG [Streptococcus marmotae]